jgi:hypothetical protein
LPGALGKDSRNSDSGIHRAMLQIVAMKIKLAFTAAIECCVSIVRDNMRE